MTKRELQKEIVRLHAVVDGIDRSVAVLESEKREVVERIVYLVAEKNARWSK